MISCCVRNRFGHPHPDALARLGATSAEVLRTDRGGVIVWETDGESVRGLGPDTPLNATFRVAPLEQKRFASDTAPLYMLPPMPPAPEEVAGRLLPPLHSGMSLQSAHWHPSSKTLQAPSSVQLPELLQ